MSERSGPLNNVRVVDLASSYAAPTTSMYLADMGADVLKVEPVRGDDARGWGPPFVGEDAAWYLTANRSKRSVCLDIRSAAGLEATYALMATADVVLLNIVPTKLAAVGLDPQLIRKRFPQAVVCVVSGYGMDGPDAGLPGYDLIAQARSGIMSVTGATGGPPQRVSAPLSDVAAGTVAAFAIASALVRQQTTGVGEIIDIALLEADLAFMRPRITCVAAGDPVPQPSGGGDSVIAVYQPFATKDDPIVVAIGNDRQWERARAALDLPEWTGSADLAANTGRRNRRAEVVGAVQDALAVLPRAEALAVFNSAGIPAAPIFSLDDVIDDDHLQARGALVERKTRTGETYLDVAPPWKLASVDRNDGFHAPVEKGEHTREALREAGLTDESIDALLTEGAAWAP
jgi:crotonobetainyl-CoA:carnitine CoA-transferase CaiB-like acyl-CoA transferase